MLRYSTADIVIVVVIVQIKCIYKYTYVAHICLTVTMYTVYILRCGMFFQQSNVIADIYTALALDNVLLSSCALCAPYSIYSIFMYISQNTIYMWKKEAQEEESIETTHTHTQNIQIA